MQNTKHGFAANHGSSFTSRHTADFEHFTPILTFVSFWEHGLVQVDPYGRCWTDVAVLLLFLVETKTNVGEAKIDYR